VIIANVHFPGVPVAPDKTNTPLVIDTNAVLALAIATQRLQTIAGWRGQVAQSTGRIQLAEFPQRNSLDAFETLNRLPVIELLPSPVTEGIESLGRSTVYR
jgi:hypothetical protein